MVSLKLGLFVFFTIFSYLHTVNGQSFAGFKTKCKNDYLLDITNGTMDKTTKKIQFQDATYPEEKYFRHDDLIYGCVCDVQLCISKCCMENHPLNITCEPGFTKHVRVDTYHENITRAAQNPRHVSTYWNNCSYYELEEGDTYYLKNDGRLYFDMEDRHFNLHEYCVAQDENENKLSVRLCFDQEELASVGQEVEEFHKYGMLISVPFLLATLIIYFILPDKKIQIKCMMAYVTCLMLSYIVLIYLQFNADLPSPHCQIMG